MGLQVMNRRASISPWRVLLPVGLGTGLSLMGDATLYTVLPTHVAEAGVVLASVGILLSANRFIRLVLNGPIGLAYDRLPRRSLFVPALFIGAASTAIYALTAGFWPLLAGRLLWGLAWAGIWVGGNTIILDVSEPHNRGRWVGVYQTAFFMGASSGAMLGGLLTDLLGYHRTMAIGAAVTLLGAIIALLFLPETRGWQPRTETPTLLPGQAAPDRPPPARWPELASAIGLMGVNRLILAGILMSTLGLFLQEQVGETAPIAGLTLGVATLTGLGLGMNSLIAMVAAPAMGRLSDRIGRRWPAAAGGLLSGVAGFFLLAWGSVLSFFLGLPLVSISSGSNQGLSTTLVGDLSTGQQRGRRLGLLFTVGDLASAVGPPLAYGLIPWLGVRGLYLLSAAGMGLMLLAAIYWVSSDRGH